MSALEQHYKPTDLARRWSVSGDTVRSMFVNEPGVLIIDRPEEMHKRAYKSMRIPASVAERVWSKYTSR